jgi:hypothetical protein
MLKKREKRIIIEIIIGVILSVALNFIMISTGYATVYSHHLNQHIVSVFGMKIFTITNAGSTGLSNPSGMMIIGIIFTIIFSILIELIVAWRGKRS